MKPVRRNGPGQGEDTRATVLLVDDDEVNLMLTRAALSSDFEVVEAGGGEEALRMLRDWKPDLIALDARMPGVDGFEVCTELREWYGYEDVPVLILTGLDDDASIQRAFRAGATDFFVKSTQWSLLVQRIRSLLRMAATHRELAQSKANLARAQDLARMGSFVWWYDASRPITRGLVLSEEALRVLGHWSVFEDPGQVSVLELLRLLSDSERHNLFRTMRLALRDNSVFTTDLPMTLSDGRERVIHIEAEPEFSEFQKLTGYRGIFQDVTERRHAEDAIRRLASTDALTTLPNRRQLMIRAERALGVARERGLMGAMLMIDLDRFKNINDTLGHYAGDELLIEVADRLRACVRHCDQFAELGLIEAAGSRSAHRQLEAVARLGGDEFVALLPEIADPADAEMVANRILAALREPLYVSGQECFATASVGIAIFPRDGDTVADLMRNADVAMYAAKNAGRNATVNYSPNLAGHGPEMLEMETALHKALERKELRLHYQPKVDVASGRVVGVEALMRWQRGDRLVPPNDFIRLAEETGLIVPMSEWVLDEAARQSRLWFDEFGFTDPIAVNMPSRMFHRSDLIELIVGAARRHGLPPHRLQLELTEGTLMTKIDEIMGRLQQINDLGVQISVDDFGTGYSSLSYLTRLPISELKIDQSFVANMSNTPKGTAVITTIVALARALGLKVIAEGVESLSQQNILHRQGCSMMQGFLFSKPLAGDEMGRWVREFHISAKALPLVADDSAPSLLGKPSLDMLGR